MLETAPILFLGNLVVSLQQTVLLTTQQGWAPNVVGPPPGARNAVLCSLPRTLSPSPIHLT
jgi:hypothetical protein